MSPVTPLPQDELVQPEPEPKSITDGGHTAPSLSTFLHDRTPNRLRGLMSLALDEAAVIMRRTDTTDVGGGAYTTWATAGTAACKITPAGGAGLRTLGGKLDETTTHTITTPPTAQVLETDRFIL